MEDTSGDAKAAAQVFSEVKERFQAIEISMDEAPSQYPRVAQREYPDSALWRCDHALSGLADTWESYEDTIDFLNGRVLIYKIFLVERDLIVLIK
jgi:hypothetical protein